jgi:regulator of sigma E protease
MNGILDLVQLIATNIWIYGVTFLAILSVLVFVHEWGHYIVARLCGVRVETFSIGFGKEIYGFTDKHGTRWKFALIPLGGYVKMFGDTDPASAGHIDANSISESDRGHAFFAKSVGQRAAIVFAGPAINFIFAIILLAGLYSYVGKPMTPPVSVGIGVDSVAAKAGFEPLDKITSINGKSIESFDEVRRAVILALDTPLNFTVLRGDKTVEINVTPEKKTEVDRFGFKHERGYLGVVGPANGFDIGAISAVNGTKTNDDKDRTRALLLKAMGSGDQIKSFQITLKSPDKELPDTTMIIAATRAMNDHFNDSKSSEHDMLILGPRNNQDLKKLNPVSAIGTAIVETYRVSVDTLGALGQMIVGTRSANELGGIIRIGAIAGDMAERGMIAVITFTALLSINLGLINLFPIPMLDGGHLVFYGIEALRGKPLAEHIQEYAFRFGLVILVCFMVFANLNDIIQLLL